MNRKYCVFDEEKLCDNCGECEVCDLNPNKKCDNCGKCLEMEGYDMKAIQIDQIIDDKNDLKEYKEEMKEESLDIKEHTVKKEDITDTNKDTPIKENITDLKEDTSNLEHNLDDQENCNDNLNEDDINIEFIDDVDGLSEILQDREKYKDLTSEAYPGLIKINTKKEKDK